MKSSATERESRLAWAICQELQKLSDLLWDRYEEDFLDLTEEEGAEQASGWERDLEIPF